MIKTGAAIFVSFILALTVDAHGAAPTKASNSTPARIRVSQSALNTRSAVLWIAQAQRFFAKNGLDAEVILLQSSNLQTGYQDLLLSLEKKPYPSLQALQNIQRLMAAINPKAAQIKPEQIIDARLIRKLDESGFIDGLYSAQKR